MTAIQIIENYFNTRLLKICLGRRREIIISTSALERGLVSHGHDIYNKLYNSQTYIRKFRLMKSLPNCKFIIEKVPTKSAEDHYSIRKKNEQESSQISNK